MSAISKNSAQLYRITYEAFSKFSNKINRCSSIEDIGEVSRAHLKYLLNFYIIRLTLQQGRKYLFFSLAGTKVEYDLKEVTQLLDHEKELLEKGIPLRNDNIPTELAKKINADALANPQLWAWYFNNNDRNVVVSLIADDNRPFAVGDIDILKLAVDCFVSKFHEIYLVHQLEKKNKSLNIALDTIQQQNMRIQKIVHNQKQIIKDRTGEIVEKNKKLLAISALNAHNVREPLSRILGLIQLFDLYEDKDIRTELLPKLEISANEMDKVLQEVIIMATEEQEQLNAQNL